MALEDEIDWLLRCREMPPPNESNTCEWIILPMLWAAGYERHEVHSRVLDSARQVPDYTVLPNKPEHVWFLEAKSWNCDLEPEHAIQALNYANTRGRWWVVLTNGHEWCLYDNRLQGCPPSERIVAEASILDPAALLEFVRAIGKDSVLSGALERYAWQARLRAMPRSRVVSSPSNGKPAMPGAPHGSLRASNLNPIERARTLHSLQEDGFTQQEIAERVGVSQPSVAQTIGLLKLPESVQTLIAEGRLSASHGEALIRLARFPEYAALVGALAAERGTPARGLKGIPFYQVAVDKGILRRLDSSAAFDWHKACLNCRAHRIAHTAGVPVRVCLRPAHWQELQDEHTAR